MMDELKILYKLISEGVNGEYKNVTFSRDTKLIDDLGYDSLSLIKLCVNIEEAFDFEMDDVVMIDEMTVGTLSDIVKNR